MIHVYPSSLSDRVWAVLAPLMPVRDTRKGGTARKCDDRLVLDGIFFVLRSGCQWRMIPHDLLPWDAVYRWYRTGSPTVSGTVSTTHYVQPPPGRDYERLTTNSAAMIKIAMIPVAPDLSVILIRKPGARSFPCYAVISGTAVRRRSSPRWCSDRSTWSWATPKSIRQAISSTPMDAIRRTISMPSSTVPNRPAVSK